MKLLLTGATGAAGLEVLRAALADSAITQVTVLSRRPLPPSVPPSPKAHVILHDDFLHFPPELTAQLVDHAACVWALGRSSRGVPEQEYVRLTHDFPMAAVAALRDARAGAGEPFRFVYFSGEGADPTGKSSLLFGRVKGQTENDLTEFAKASNGSVKAHILRPGYFFPVHSEDRKTLRGGGARLLDGILSPLMSVLAPSAVIPIQDLGRFAVEVAKGRYGDEELFRNARMRELAKQWKADGKKDEL